MQCMHVFYMHTYTDVEMQFTVWGNRAAEPPPPPPTPPPLPSWHVQQCSPTQAHKYRQNERFWLAGIQWELLLLLLLSPFRCRLPYLFVIISLSGPARSRWGLGDSMKRESWSAAQRRVCVCQSFVIVVDGDWAAKTFWRHSSSSSTNSPKHSLSLWLQLGLSPSSSRVCALIRFGWSFVSAKERRARIRLDCNGETRLLLVALLASHFFRQLCALLLAFD